jgi:hypothetical protein
MSRVSISRKSARALVDEFPGGGAYDRAMAELRAALSKTRRLSEKRRPALKAKAAKKRGKGEETKEIRAAIVARSGGHCEICRCPGSEMHHALGRKVQQSVANCAWLCRTCHADISHNRPSALAWFTEQAQLFESLCYPATADALSMKAATARAKSELSRQAEERAAQ